MADAIQPSEFEAAFRAGQTIGNSRPASPGYYVVVPDGHKIESLNSIAWEKKPAERNHKPNLADLGSFTAYVNSFRTPATRIFADPVNRRFVGVLDYSTPEAADFREHRANFQIKLHADFELWKSKSGARMKQEEFALFVEENTPVFVKPDAATMRELSSDLQISNDFTFQEATRTQDGQRKFSYIENLQGKAGKSGEIAIPPMFTLSMPIFYGCKTQEISAFFRYRLIGGKLSLWYDLYRADEIVDNAFESAIADIEKITDTVVWRGIP